MRGLRSGTASDRPIKTDPSSIRQLDTSRPRHPKDAKMLLDHSSPLSSSLSLSLSLYAFEIALSPFRKSSEPWRRTNARRFVQRNVGGQTIQTPSKRVSESHAAQRSLLVVGNDRSRSVPSNLHCGHSIGRYYASRRGYFGGCSTVMYLRHHTGTGRLHLLSLSLIPTYAHTYSLSLSLSLSLSPIPETRKRSALTRPSEGTPGDQQNEGHRRRDERQGQQRRAQQQQQHHQHRQQQRGGDAGERGTSRTGGGF